MSTLKERQQLISNAAERMGKETFKGTSDKVATPRSEYQKESTKVVSLEDAIRKSGLKDGMTISFHHHFRSGDKVINMVVAKLAEMGYKNLHLASSSLIDVHEPLIEHIRNGVITRISTSGLRGKLAAEVSHGLMDEPVVFRSHGSRGAAIANGDLHIDVAFIGASSADPLGNACGYSRSENAKSICGSLGYALPRFGADGDFGEETLAAVKKFQRDHDMEETGLCDATTFKTLLAAQTPTNETPAQEPDTPDGGSEPAYVLIIEGKRDMLKLVQSAYGGTLALVDSVEVMDA